MKTTAYDILDVRTDATPEEIEAAYQAQLQAVDPSVLKRQATTDTAFRYRVLREAHAVLADPARRRAYDEALRLPLHPVPIAPMGGEPEYRAWCSPGAVILLIGAFFLGSALWAKHSYDVHQARLADARAAAEGASQARREAVRAQEQQAAARFRDDQRRIGREMEQARQEGQRIHESLWQAERAAAEQERRALYERERQARNDEYREQALAQQRLYMQRALLERRQLEYGYGRAPAVVAFPAPRITLSDAR